MTPGLTFMMTFMVTFMTSPRVTDLHERCSICLEQPLGDVFELSRLGDDDPLLVLRGRQVHVHLADGLDALGGEHAARRVRQAQTGSKTRYLYTAGQGQCDTCDVISLTPSDKFRQDQIRPHIVG